MCRHRSGRIRSPPDAAAAKLGVSVGVHTAEVGRRGAHVAGDGVRVANELAARAPHGEVWVTSTVRDLTAGAGLTFDLLPHVEVMVAGQPLGVSAAV